MGLNEFSLPIRLDRDEEYAEHLKKTLNKYIEFNENIEGLPEELLKDVKENVDLILNSLHHYYNANISKAKECIHKLLGKYISNDFIVSELDESYAFRGIACFESLKVDGQNDELKKNYPLSFFKARIGNYDFQRNDMLHIPFNKRELVTTQRFSIPGVPCLYLGTTSYVCWLELNKPSDSEFNVSCYKMPGNLKILNLVSDQMLINGQTSWIKINNNQFTNQNITLLKALIGFFPLIIATSYSINNSNRAFKSEYIISQLIMQCLDDFGIDGIAYMSKKAKDGIGGFPQCVNLAIPMKYDGNGQGYSNLFKEIQLTPPINLAEFKKLKNRIEHGIKESYINRCYETFGYNAQIDLGGVKHPYKHTEFSDFDNWLYCEKLGYSFDKGI